MEPHELNSIDLDDLLYSPEHEINLSPNLNRDILWNDGKKNIVSTKDGSIMKLGHLNPEAFHLNNKERLKKSIKKASSRKDGKVCFAVDCRNKKLITVLAKGGVHTDTKCRVFSFSPFLRPLDCAHTLSISTGEI